MTCSLFRIIAAAALVSSACVASVFAEPISWKISNVVFDDGGTLAGTFIFDATTGQYSSINLFSTAGTTITSNRHYGSPYPVSPGNSSLMIAIEDASLPLDGQGALVLTWGANLTDAGTTTRVLPASLGFSFEGFVNNGNLPGQRVAVGTLATVASVPEPSTLAIMALALAGMVAVRRYRQD